MHFHLFIFNQRYIPTEACFIWTSFFSSYRRVIKICFCIVLEPLHIIAHSCKEKEKIKKRRKKEKWKKKKKKKKIKGEEDEEEEKGEEKKEKGKEK